MGIVGPGPDSFIKGWVLGFDVMEGILHFRGKDPLRNPRSSALLGATNVEVHRIGACASSHVCWCGTLQEYKKSRTCDYFFHIGSQEMVHQILTRVHHHVFWWGTSCRHGFGFRSTPGPVSGLL